MNGILVHASRRLQFSSLKCKELARKVHKFECLTKRKVAKARAQMYCFIANKLSAYWFSYVGVTAHTFVHMLTFGPVGASCIRVIATQITIPAIANFCTHTSCDSSRLDFVPEY